MAIDILDYLKTLDLERYRGIYIHTVPENCEALTKFITRVAKKANGKYIDLLNQFIQSKKLSENIDSFRPEKMRSFIIEQSKSQSLLIVDRVDFLLDTWKKKDRESFYQIILDRWDGYKEDTKVKLIICLQTSSEIDNLKNIVSRTDRVFQLDEFNEI